LDHGENDVTPGFNIFQQFIHLKLYQTHLCLFFSRHNTAVIFILTFQVMIYNIILLDVEIMKDIFLISSFICLQLALFTRLKGLVNHQF